MKPTKKNKTPRHQQTRRARRRPRPESDSKREAEKRQLVELLRRPSTDFKSWFVEEPALVFGDGREAPDPKTGLALYGPCGTMDDQSLATIRVGIIGTGETIQEAQRWLDRCRSTIDPPPPEDIKDGVDPYLFPSFPGVQSPQGFNCSLEFPSHLAEKLSPTEVDRCTNAANRDAAVEQMAKIVGERLDVLKDSETPPDVVLVALPEQVRVVAGGARNPRRQPRKPQKPLPAQLNFFDERREEPYPTSRTLHRAIKAEGMRYELPTQLVWPTTFAGGEGIQDDATRAWNFCTALYYKAGGMPWRSTGLAPNTCYVGISFFRPFDQPGQLETSMAQAFSERGHGIVLRGTTFEWDERRQGPPHLPKAAATSLIAGVVEQYKKHHRQPPSRVVIHKSSQFSDDEIAGFQEGISDVPFFDFASVGRSNIRFLRVGNEPPIRGTALQIARNRYVVYTRGYVPFLGLYPGLRIPRPIEIIHAKGSAPITELVREFFALTRMNWNSADFASADPITLSFARNIGLILSELPRDIEPARYFRFYM